jgi:hypothetical protein
VHHSASPTLAGVLLHRRRLGPRRSPLIQHDFFQLIVPTPSLCLTEAFAQVGCQRSPPELRRHLGLKSNPTVPAIPVHDT